jgi:hypothetical protein
MNATQHKERDMCLNCDSFQRADLDDIESVIDLYFMGGVDGANLRRAIYRLVLDVQESGLSDHMRKVLDAWCQTGTLPRTL